MRESKITGRWVCVWPDKSRSIVFDAWSVLEAIEALDEIGPAEPHMLYPIPAEPACIDYTVEKVGRIQDHTLFMTTEELYAEVCKRRKKKTPAGVVPVSDKAEKLAKYLGMSQTLANHRWLESSADLAQEKPDGP